jgi:zinc and cadmium transporter
MTLLGWIVLTTLIGGVAAALIASTFLLLPERARAAALPRTVSFAIGTLLGAAFLGLLPHALGAVGLAGAHQVGLAFALGILLFFALEKALVWRHCHTHDCDAHGPDAPHDHDAMREQAAGKLIMVGDALHNAVDGALIAAAFLTDVHLGIVTAVAVFAHEVPQEVGDVAVLLHAGYPRRQAFLLNLAVGLTTVAGGLIAYFALAEFQSALPYVLAVAAGSFVYVAVADLIPGLHRRTDPRGSVEQIVLIAAGLALIYFSHSALH